MSFRIWADKAHKDSLSPIKPRSPRFKCSTCIHRLTKNQAKASKGYCTHCRSKLKAYNQFAIKLCDVDNNYCE